MQQLVYTVQGIQQERLPVLVQNGADPAPLFGIDTGRAQGRQAARRARARERHVARGGRDGQRHVRRRAAWPARSRRPCPGRSATRRAPRWSRASPPADGWIDKLYPWETTVDVSGPRAGHLHVRGDDRRPVRRRGRRSDRGHQDDRRSIASRGEARPPRLNRTLLLRQHLLERTSADPAARWPGTSSGSRRRRTCRRTSRWPRGSTTSTRTPSPRVSRTARWCGC